MRFWQGGSSTRWANAAMERRDALRVREAPLRHKGGHDNGVQRATRLSGTSSSPSLICCHDVHGPPRCCLCSRRWRAVLAISKTVPSSLRAMDRGAASSRAISRDLVVRDIAGMFAHSSFLRFADRLAQGLDDERGGRGNHLDGPPR